MLTLLGSLLGFVTSAFPDLLALVRDWQDSRHKLATLDRQMEQMKLGHQQRPEGVVMGDDAQEPTLTVHHRQRRQVVSARSAARPPRAPLRP